jgi:hypothetical protein
MATQTGYLVLADISGFTSFLATTELEHSHEIMTELLELIIGKFKPLLTLSKLEGDAVFAYASESKVTRGETLIEMLEATYLAFKDRVGAVHRRTTCTCNACRAIPTLDLKFMAHHGEYIIQKVADREEVVGSDVNLVHRLLKNHVSEATGWRAYALFTQKCLERIGVQPDGAHTLTENYEHLGDVPTQTINLQQRYKELSETRRVFVEPTAAYVSSTHEYPVPPLVVWDWLNDAQKRAQYLLHEGPFFEVVQRQGGRTGVGTRNHCVHGKDVAMVEDILDWKPFDYLTIEQRFMGIRMVMTMQLTPIDDSNRTRLRMTINGEGPVPRFLTRLFFKFAFTKMFPMSQMFEKMKRRISEAQASAPAA